MIFRAVVRMVAEVALWTAIIAAIAALAAISARRLPLRDPPSPGSLFGAALVGALLFAGLADRLGVPAGLAVDLGRRPLPLAWVVTGAVVGTAGWWWHVRRGRRPGDHPAG